ncbi:MAG TPA: transglutaminase family protein, partial [Terracidiphilus sp.]|nr:transglutaminase family protein [Terracidiphilus sp.]
GIQNSVPVVYQSMELDLPASTPYAVSWHAMEPLKPVEVAPNHWRWEIKDRHRLDLRDVPSRPDWAALAAWASLDWGDVGVTGTDNRWRAMGNFFTSLEAGRPDPTPEITAETQQLIAGAPDYFTKLQRITEYIQKNVRYFIVMRGIGGWQANPAGEIFRNRYGDCKDKTTLLISMLRVAGIQAFYVPVDHRRGVVDPSAPSFYGDHMITAIEIPSGVTDKRLRAVATGKTGKRYLIFDPTNQEVPVGDLPSYEQGGYGLLSAGEESQVLALPVLEPDASLSVRSGSFTLAGDGTLTGTVKVDRDGTQGADLRGALLSLDQKQRRDELERGLASDLPGVVLNSFDYATPPELDKPVALNFAFSAGAYAHTAGNLLLVRPRVVGSDGLAFDDAPRTVPINLRATGEWKDSFDIKLPAGYVVDELPDAVNVDVGFASYHAKSTAAGGVLHYERDYEVKQVQIPTAQAADFRKLEGAILGDERGTAVLRPK